MTTTAEILRGLPYFANLDESLLEAVCARSEQISVDPGTVLIEEGSKSEEMYVIVEGEVRVIKRSGDREVDLARLETGDVVGEIALLDEAPRTATVVAERKTLLVRVPVEAFEILLSDPSVVRRMFHTVTSRLRGIENTLRHEERMAALGRMAAQLMHELNNPAAAVARTSQGLAGVTVSLNTVADELAHRLTDGVDLTPPAAPTDLSPLDQSAFEDDIAAYLESLDIDDAWDLAPAMVTAGWSGDALEAALSSVDSELRRILARWIGLRATARQLTDEVGIGASRISELVRVVKEYSYVDQAPVQEVDIIKGVKDTLILMKHKLGEVDVVTRFDDYIPRVEAPGRDLNQIWTNLIDNAADAMESGGTMTLAATTTPGFVVVTISDTGTGMPDNVAAKIFDPFFTTKEPGKGTGLGLHTVHTIINRIGGDISLDTSPNGTVFTVHIPTS